MWMRLTGQHRRVVSSPMTGGGDVGAQRLGKRVMTRDRMLFAAFLVQP
jgi:hypothetical protein